MIVIIPNYVELRRDNAAQSGAGVGGTLNPRSQY